MKMPAYVQKKIGTAVPAWIAGFSDEFRPAILRLITDKRMEPLWRGKFDERHLRSAAEEFTHAIDRDRWTNKTQRERDTWLVRFEKTFEELILLMDDGPTTSRMWGFPVKDHAIANIAQRWGLPIAANDFNKFWTEVQNLERKADEENFTLVDALEHFRLQIRTDCTAKQILKKPGDEHAGRAEFLHWFKNDLSAGDVTIVAAVLFEDEGIDKRLVRRRRAHPRAHSSKN